MLGGRDADVHQGLDGDGRQVRADPVEAHARRDEDAEDQRQADGQPVGGVLLGARLLLLERVDAVLREAHRHGGKAGQKRHDPRGAAVGDGDHAQELGSRGAAVGDGVDDVDQAEQDDDLDQKRDHREQRVVAALFVQGVLLLADCLAVAVVLDLDAVERGHELDHDDRVLLDPQRHRQQDDLGDEGEQQDRDPPVPRQPIARVDNELKHGSDSGKYSIHIQ